MDLIDALENTGIRFVLTGHEAAAAFMASAVGRLTGTPGVCLATLGPGACNLVLGVGAAFLDRDPMLAISARSPASRSGVSQKQNLSLHEVFDPVCKWSVAGENNGIETTVRSAMGLATAAPAGPVYLTIPNDVAVADASPGGGVRTPDRLNCERTGDPDTILKALNRARRPVGIGRRRVERAAGFRRSAPVFRNVTHSVCGPAAGQGRRGRIRRGVSGHGGVGRGRRRPCEADPEKRLPAGRGLRPRRVGAGMAFAPTRLLRGQCLDRLWRLRAGVRVRGRRHIPARSAAGRVHRATVVDGGRNP